MRARLLFYLLCLLPFGSFAQSGAVVAGTVQSEAGEPLPGVTVFFKGTSAGTTTDDRGAFSLKADFSRGPLTLVVSYVGFQSQELPVSGPNPALAVRLKTGTMLDQVVVSASRVAESFGQVPVTVEKLDTRKVANLTSPDLVAGLARMKSIDVSSSSMLTTSFSTRGFNSSRSDRVIQLADYTDTQIPSLSLNVGNLLGIPILDVASVEVVHGPASALYGANAFNGVLLTNSKDPFTETGLSVRLRGGNRSMLDGQLRYAVKLSERVAFKLTGGYFEANDFTADNQDATSKLIEANNNPAGSNLGYDAVSRYGDIGTPLFTAAPIFPGGPPNALAGKAVFLPGFTEANLVEKDNPTKSLKIAPTLSVMLTDKIRATAGYRYSSASTSFQAGSRYRFVNSGAQQYRLALEGDNWFVRGFSTQDFSGGRDPKTDGSYNLGFLGAFLQAQQAIGANGQPVVDAQGQPVSYGTRYVRTYVGAYNTLFYTPGPNAGNADAAALFARNTANANAPLLQPGTDAFNQARTRIIQDPTPGRGARLVLRSFLNEGSGQYNFKSDIADVVVGGAYRQYLLGSDGSLFADSPTSDRISNYEFGGYAQISKSLADDRLRLSAAGRVDQFQNFGSAFSPRVSAVYTAGADKQHNIRASFSRAFRSATQDGQYIRLDVGRAILLGNVGGGFQGYLPGLVRGLPGILAASRDAELKALEFNSGKLRLEEVNSTEIGYRAQVSSKLFVDFDYFYSFYNDFIVAQNFIGNLDGTRPTRAQIGVGAGASFGPTIIVNGQPQVNPTRVIQINTNVDQSVRTQGAGLTVGYRFSPAFTLTGNYSFNNLITDTFREGVQSFFNTPTNKFNLGADGLLLERRLNYSVNYRYTDSFLYESTFATGTLPSTNIVDAQLGYTLPTLHTTLQVGGSNLLDQTNFQVYGAPSLGRLVYVGLLFDIK